MNKVLVAEDDGFLANALRVKLTKTGYEVAMASDGEEAEKLFVTFKPDLLLLDLLMPKQDGFTVLQEIRKKDTKLPIIVSSNLSQKEDLEKAMKLGATDYVVKSESSLEQIIEKMNKYLKV